jgi:hypothetical protein
MDIVPIPDERHTHVPSHRLEDDLVLTKIEDVCSEINEEDDVGSTSNGDEDVKPRVSRDYHIWTIREDDEMLRKLWKMKRKGYQTRTRNFRMIAYKAVAGMLTDQFKEKFTPESVKNRWRLLRSRWNRAKVEAETPWTAPNPNDRPRKPFSAGYLLRHNFHHMERLLEQSYVCRPWDREGWTGQWETPRPVSTSSSGRTVSRRRRHRRHHDSIRNDADLSDGTGESRGLTAAELSHVQAECKLVILTLFAAAAEFDDEDDEEEYE